jgi:TatA/E family protein of Tat protein translocase
MGPLSLTHLLVLVIVVLILFRPQRIQELTKAIGKSIKGFRDAKNEIDAEYKELPDDKKDS